MRVVVADDLACGLVVRNHPRWRRVNPDMDRFAVDLDLVAVLHALADVGGLVVDHDAAFSDQLFHLQARAHARLSQNFVQFGRVGLGREHAFAQIDRHIFRGFFVVKLARHHIGQSNRFVDGFAGRERLWCTWLRCCLLAF